VGVLNTASAAAGNSSLTGHIIRGISWQFALSIAGRGLTFTTALIQTHFLGRAGYGELGMALSTIMLFGFVSNAAGGQTSTKYIAELRYDFPGRASRIAALSILVTLLFTVVAGASLFLAADIVATRILNTPRLSRLLDLAALAMAAQALANTFGGILLGLQLYRTEAIVRFIQLPVWLLATVLLTTRFGVLGAMVAYTTSVGVGLVAAAFASMVALRHAGLTLDFSRPWSEAKVLAKYSLPLLLHDLLCVPTIWACNAILARQPAGFAALGSYTAAMQFRTAAILLPTNMQTVIWPILSEFHGRQKTDQFNRLFMETMRSIWSVSLLITIALTMFQRQLMALFGKGFSEDYVVFGLCLSCTPTILASSFSGLALQVLDKTWSALYANVAYSAASIALTYILAPVYGSAGMAIAFVSSTAIQFTWLALLLSKTSPALRLRENTAVMLASVGTALGVTYIAASEFELKLAMEITVVVTAGWLVWSFRPDLRRIRCH
jgi:O-antigen/teichoic acid export membrane protein